jgi:hypothetical protein
VQLGVVGKAFRCGGSLLLVLMKEDEGKQGFVAAKCSVFIPVLFSPLFPCLPRL